MPLYSDLYTYLKTVAGITNLVGSGDNTRIYPMLAAEGVTTPYVVYQVITGPIPGYAFSGEDGLSRSIVQFSCYDEDYDDAKAVQTQIKTALSAFTGELAASGTNVRGAFISDQRDLGYFDSETLMRSDIDVEMFHT